MVIQCFLFMCQPGVMSSWVLRSASESSGSALRFTICPPSNSVRNMNIFQRIFHTSMSNPNGWVSSVPGSSCARDSACFCKSLPSMSYLKPLSHSSLSSMVLNLIIVHLADTDNHFSGDLLLLTHDDQYMVQDS